MKKKKMMMKKQKKEKRVKLGQIPPLFQLDRLCNQEILALEEEEEEEEKEEKEKEEEDEDEENEEDEEEEKEEGEEEEEEEEEEDEEDDEEEEGFKLGQESIVECFVRALYPRYDRLFIHGFFHLWMPLDFPQL
uniref:ADH1C protein n=1 Tax=Solanum tuberosum TaxID=4113 RepID=M1DL64_SOLTU